MERIRFTIFTGCYNSENFIQRVFDSLDKQTYRDFEWIVIDDKSSDNTVSLVTEYLKTVNFEHQIFINEENKGVKFNRKRAISLAKGDFFITWDHDDIQLPDQLEFFNNVWDEYGTPKIANIMASMENQHGKFVGKKFEKDLFVINYFSHFDFLLKNRNENMVCTKTSVLREIPEKFEKYNVYFDSAILWSKIATKYNSIYTNKIVRIYYQDPKSNSLSNQKRGKTATTNLTYKSIWINEFFSFMKGMWLVKFRYLFGYAFYGLLSTKPLNEIFKPIESGVNKILIGILLPIAFVTKVILGLNNKL